MSFKNALCKLAAVAAITLGSAQKADASPVYLYGTQSWWRSGVTNYYRSVPVTGRYSNMGGGYYWANGYCRSNIDHPYGSDYTYSGTLSLEFWGLPYYGSSTGWVMRTRRFNNLYEGYYYSPAMVQGVLRKLNRNVYPSIVMFEYSPGWYFRDDHDFGRAARF